MTPLPLWPHQQAAINATLLALAAGRTSGLIVLPTGCVSGDTVIGLNRAGKGYHRTIARAYEAQAHPYRDPAIPTSIRSFMGSWIGLNGLDGIQYTGIKTTWTLLLEDGRSLRATPDHEVLSERGFVALADLKDTDRVVCEISQPPGRRAKKRYRMVQGLRHHPFAQGVASRHRRNRKPEGRLYRVAYHRLVYEASLNRLGVEEFIDICRADQGRAADLRYLDPTRVAVHHVDDDTRNNVLGNLAPMTHEEHWALHGRVANKLNFGKGQAVAVRVESIQEYGPEPVYDATCADPHHNFVANGIVVHNCGKTGLVLALGRQLGVPMLFLVNRDVLLSQTLKAAPRFWPDCHAVALEANTKAWDEPDLESGRPPDLLVAMVPTLVNRLGTISPERFGIVVADEAHLSVAPTWRRVIDHFAPGFVLGVTATPQRLDGKGLAGRYGREPLYSYSLHQAIKDGRLSPIKVKSMTTEVDLDGVASVAGDLAEAALAKAVDTKDRNALVVETYQRHGAPRRAVAFCVDVDHATHLAEAFARAGLRCAPVTGRTAKAERPKLLAAFAAGGLDVLTTCEVLTTGFDDPGVSCLLMTRPTESRGLYVQMAGRGLRLHPGKADCLLIDFVDASKRHKLVSPLDLLGRSKEPAKTEPHAPAQPAEPKLPHPPQGRGKIVAWRLESVCPWPELPTLEGYAPSAPWHGDPASEGQLRYLAAFGVSLPGGLTKGEASYLIDRSEEYEAAFPRPATPRQEALLRHEGLWTEGMGKRQAGVLITQIKQRERLQAAGVVA